MFPLAQLVVALHVIADCLWVGALVSALYLVRPTGLDTAALRARAVFARELHKNLASPARWAALGFGLYRFVESAKDYAHMPWMHAKLTLAVLLFGLHDVAGAKLRKFADGTSDKAPAAWFLWASLGLTTGIVLLAILKSFLL